MTTDATGVVLYERDGRLAYVTLNRPERLNAFNPEQWDGLEAALADRRAHGVRSVGEVQ